MLKKLSFAAYGVVCYAIFLGTFLPAWFFMDMEGNFLFLHHHLPLRLATFGGALVWFRLKFSPTSFFIFLVGASVAAVYLGLAPAAK